MDIGLHSTAGIGQLLLVALLVGWVLYRQVTGRFASPAAAVRLPLILTALGLLTLLGGHPQVTPWALGLVVLDLVLTAGLGLVRGAAVMLTERDGFLYQRGGGPAVALWVVTIGVRIGVGVLAAHTGAGALVESTLMLSFGISLLAQGLVLRHRALADGRPVKPASRAGRDRATLGR
ncbi:MAG: hypothetical protein OJJ54_06125 [Pseudonocardia sp.]|nr:hypothetical protein [Pseudonocardia sp.]